MIEANEASDLEVATGVEGSVGVVRLETPQEFSDDFHPYFPWFLHSLGRHDAWDDDVVEMFLRIYRNWKVFPLYELIYAPSVGLNQKNVPRTGHIYMVSHQCEHEDVSLSLQLEQIDDRNVYNYMVSHPYEVSYAS